MSAPDESEDRELDSNTDRLVAGQTAIADKQDVANFGASLVDR
jgi:hypothetical protein